MKTNHPTKKLGETKESIQPNWEESEFAKTIDGQIMVMLRKAIKNKHFIEAQALSWTAVEQLLLPRLIGWVAKSLKVNLPKYIYKLNTQNINLLYFCISHDEELYGNLEKTRKQRNKITHEITSFGEIGAINKFAIKCTKENILLQQKIMKRFDGVVLIPSINLYKNGWNDCRKEILKSIGKIEEELTES